MLVSASAMPPRVRGRSWDIPSFGLTRNVVSVSYFLSRSDVEWAKRGGSDSGNKRGAISEQFQLTHLAVKAMTWPLHGDRLPRVTAACSARFQMREQETNNPEFCHVFLQPLQGNSRIGSRKSSGPPPSQIFSIRDITDGRKLLQYKFV